MALLAQSSASDVWLLTNLIMLLLVLLSSVEDVNTHFKFVNILGVCVTVVFVGVKLTKLLSEDSGFRTGL